MTIKSILSGLLHKVIGYRTKIVVSELRGHRMSTTEGTIPAKADKDDAWFYALCNNHEDIFDIGSNVGYASILASVNDPYKRIVLVDPNPMALTQAAGNLIRSNLSVNKTFILSFVSEKSGEKIKFYTIGAGAAGSMFSSAAQTASKINSFYWVDTMTIDQIMDKTGIVPNLLKIDIEGAESLALKGATKLAALQKAKMMVEMHAPAEMPMLKNAGLVLAWCNENHYHAYYMSEHRRITSAEEIARRGRCHLLLVPQNMEYPAYLKSIREGDELPTT